MSIDLTLTISKEQAESVLEDVKKKKDREVVYVRFSADRDALVDGLEEELQEYSEDNTQTLTGENQE